MASKLFELFSWALEKLTDAFGLSEKHLEPSNYDTGLVYAMF